MYQVRGLWQGFAQKVTCQQYSTASEARRWHTQRTNHQILGLISSVPPPRFARGTVLIARHSPRLEFLCKALWQWKKSAGRTFISHESSAICHIDRVPGFHDHTIRLFVSFSASLCDPLALLCDASVYTTRMNSILDSERRRETESGAELDR